MSGPKIHLGTQYPVQRSEDVDRIMHAPVGDNGTSKWLWITLANGDVIFGCYPRGDTYMDCEVAITEDWQASQHDGTSETLTVPVSDAVVEDEDPAHPVFAPARGDEQWIGYARAEQAPTSVQFSDQEADQKLDWLLRAVTAEGADVNQRRYDLESIAKIVTENPQAGYGRMPIDTDVHGTECVICRGASDDAAFSLGPLGRARDGHPYTEQESEGKLLIELPEGVYYIGDLDKGIRAATRDRFDAEGNRVLPDGRTVYVVHLADHEFPSVEDDSNVAEFGVSSRNDREEAWRFALGAMFGPIDAEYDDAALREVLDRPATLAEKVVGKTVTSVRERRMAGQDTYKEWHTWTETILVFNDGSELALGGDDAEVYDVFEYDHLTNDGDPVKKENA